MLFLTLMCFHIWPVFYANNIIIIASITVNTEEYPDAVCEGRWCDPGVATYENGHIINLETGCSLQTQLSAHAFILRYCC